MFEIVMWSARAVIALTSVPILVLSLYQIRFKRNPFGLTRWLSYWGIFVWGDGFPIALFWISLSLLSLIAQNIWVFSAGFFLFWIVRSLGEVVYWLLQQFVKPQTNTPKSLFGYSVYKDESIWFAYQVVWQLLSVFSSLGLIYSLIQWLKLT